MFLSVYQDILSILFPKYCIGCQQICSSKENFLCPSCRHELRETSFHLQPNNPMKEKFWGRIPIEQAMALLYYQKGGVTQKLIHALKYQGQEQIGKWLGEWYAQRLLASNSLQTVEVVIPVPLHPKKMKKRGYNQVTLFGKAIAQALQVPFLEDVLLKQTYTSSQTKKHWLERQESHSEQLFLAKIAPIQNKHILLVDDIVTTGATLTRCASLIIENASASVSLTCMAYSLNE